RNGPAYTTQPSHGVVTWAPARVAKEMPLSTPPAPSEAPNSRILTPLTGIANKPLADAKAMAGLIRAGSLSAPGLGLPLGAPCRLAVAGGFAAALQTRSHV